jgi:hypothetical protein
MRFPASAFGRVGSVVMHLLKVVRRHGRQRPAIHAFLSAKTWMPATSAGMTT